MFHYLYDFTITKRCSLSKTPVCKKLRENFWVFHRMFFEKKTNPVVDNTVKSKKIMFLSACAIFRTNIIHMFFRLHSVFFSNFQWLEKQVFLVKITVF